MSRSDYKAISKIIKDVVGEDTLTAGKLLEGIKFYLKSKVKKVKLITPEKTVTSTVYLNSPNIEANAAMKRYTEKLKKESEKYRKKRDKVKACTTNS